MPAIEITNLKKYFGKTRAVDGVSLTVEQGEIFGFLGPNGAGKSTTIRCMMDIIHPLDGDIRIFEQDAHRNSVELKRRIGYLPGAIRLKDSWSGHDYINFVRKLKSCPDNSGELLKRMNFNPVVKTRHLSLGNRQKLGLILAFLGDPELLILDEPTLGLDPLFQNIVYEMISEAGQRGATVFMSSHNLSDVEKICRRVGIIKLGRMAAAESISTLKEMRIYRVQAGFEGHIDKAVFELEGVTLVNSGEDFLELEVKGDINALVSRLSAYKLYDLQILHASLQDIFMEFYEK